MWLSRVVLLASPRPAAQEVFQAAWRAAARRCEQAQLLDLQDDDLQADSGKSVVALLQGAVDGLAQHCGPFHTELYQLRGQLMTAQLTRGA